MPIYEYRCLQCDHQLEIVQKMNDPAPPQCPKCSAEGKLERLVSRSSFHLKGSGWYADLYSSKKESSGGEAKPAEAKTAPATAETSSTATSTASAPAAQSSSPSSSKGTSSSD